MDCCKHFLKDITRIFQVVNPLFLQSLFWICFKDFSEIFSMQLVRIFSKESFWNLFKYSGVNISKDYCTNSSEYFTKGSSRKYAEISPRILYRGFPRFVFKYSSIIFSKNSPRKSSLISAGTIFFLLQEFMHALSNNNLKK